jgi:hypothetical protein
LSYNLILNFTNNISVNNNRYQYNFINGSFKVPKEAEINIVQVTIPYSWYNVTCQVCNNTFQYFIANSADLQTAYTVRLANGFYQISYIQITPIYDGAILNPCCVSKIKNNVCGNVPYKWIN